jgi:hypothetical protein
MGGPSAEAHVDIGGFTPRSLNWLPAVQDNGKGAIKFVNIAADDYNPSKNMGIEYEEAMETIHAILPDGSVSFACARCAAVWGESHVCMCFIAVGTATPAS